jgi:hypothetical protein
MESHRSTSRRDGSNPSQCRRRRRRELCDVRRRAARRGQHATRGRHRGARTHSSPVSLRDGRAALCRTAPVGQRALDGHPPATAPTGVTCSPPRPSLRRSASPRWPTIRHRVTQAWLAAGPSWRSRSSSRSGRSPCHKLDSLDAPRGGARRSAAGVSMT